MGRNLQSLLTAALVITVGGLVLVTSSCNQYPVAIVETTGAIEERVPVGGTEAEKLDILWMIDNSGSMCRSQGVLRDGIEEFIEIIGQINLDFHIGVTTTHVTEASMVEPVAQSGRLQSTPQPLPGFDENCHHPLDATGQPIRDDMSPVVTNLEVAIACTENPEQWGHLMNVTSHELRCALDFDYQTSPACSAAEAARDIADYFPPNGFCDTFTGRCQGAGGEACDSHSDCSSVYREIPLVLRSEDYRDQSGAIDTDAFAADFACMSLVGTRGWGFERGLASVVKTLSPEMTGGPDAEPGSAPNAGFLRSDSQLAVIFITDENDCSSKEGFNEQTFCDVHWCTIQENLGEDGDLIPVDELRYDFLRNVAASKGLIATDDQPSLTELNVLVGDQITAASVHGPYLRDLEVGPDDCVPAEVVSPGCRTTFGVAWSGHRYAEFISGFQNHLPEAQFDSDTGEADITDVGGEICTQDQFEELLLEIAENLRAEAAGCIRNVYSCDGPDDGSCPAHAQTGEPGNCVPYPGFAADDEDAEFFCDTGIEVRLANAPDFELDIPRIEATGWCVEPVDVNSDLPDSCVVDPQHYSWVLCGDTPGARMSLEWEDPQWEQVLDGLSAVARFTRIP